MQRILLVEDSREIQLIAQSLFSSKYDFRIAGTLAEARKQLAKESFDLILLDLSLPDGSGFGLLVEINANYPNLAGTPVFFLSANADDSNKLQAFQLGAQDYISKPFSPAEMKARVEARLRRANAASDDTIQKGNLVLSVSTQRATVTGKDQRQSGIDLSPLEFKLLLYLMRNPDHVLSRGQIMEQVWGSHVLVLDRTVDAHISHLRKKLVDADFNVQTIVGAGYSFRKVQTGAAKLAA